MKKLLLTLFILLFTLSYAQIDTLNYLKKFEVNKEKYIGKPFSVLLKDMKKIQPTAISSAPAIATSFTFNKRSINDEVINLLIEWQPYIPLSEINYYENKNKNHFTQEERNFFEKKIIKNISVIILGPVME